MKELWMISAKYFVAGLEVNENGIVVNCAPILAKWCANQHISRVKKLCERRKLDIEKITEAERDLVSTLFVED